MERKINDAANEALAKTKRIFGVDDVVLKIVADPEQTIPETGIGGYTPDSYNIFVYYDPDNENFKDNACQEIKSTVTHEFHHAIRNRTYNWEQDTLLGAMVTEGLADHFDIEVNNGIPKPWSISLLDDDLENIKKMAAPELHSREYNHHDWFFGSEERRIPKWAGYALGFKLVSDYLKRSGKKASELVAEPAESFV